MMMMVDDTYADADDDDVNKNCQFFLWFSKKVEKKEIKNVKWQPQQQKTNFLTTNWDG